MPEEELPPNPDVMEQWQNLPQNKPSKDALPPVAGGFPRWLWWVLGAVIVIGIIGAIVQGGV